MKANERPAYDCRRPGLFITGTDTGVGKTYVTAALARLLRQRGEKVSVCKPVATGASLLDGQLVSEDTLCLAEAVGAADAWQTITPWTFAEPLAPPVAARRQGVTLTLELLAAAVAQQRQESGLLLVEGVGGLLCPLTEQETVADLAALLRLPVVVVARRALGTLNHTVLTVEAARRRGLAVAGVVVSETTPPQGVAEQTNVDELRRRLDVPVLAVVQYQAGPAALAGVNWHRLCAESDDVRLPAGD